MVAGKDGESRSGWPHTSFHANLEVAVVKFGSPGIVVSNATCLMRKARSCAPAGFNLGGRLICARV